ncbi:hypothetical protein Tco_1256523 [Tanacetum coccineum]
MLLKEKFKPNPEVKVRFIRNPVLRLRSKKEKHEFKAKVKLKRKMILSKEYDKKRNERTTPSSLFSSANKNSRADILGFLTDIGFSSLHNVSIDPLPSKLGWIKLEKIDDEEIWMMMMGDLFGDNSATLEAMNQEITPEKLPTQKASPSPKKRDVKPSSYLLSPYMNKKTNVVPKITRLEFILGNSLFAMQGNKILTKTTAMTILDKSPGTYDLKYKEVCDLLKKLFARHLKQYGHIRHTQVSRVKQTIPKLKWKTKENFHDYGIFTMLHMETFDGGPASNLDCRLPKMFELAMEFDKTDPVEKMAIIVDAFKKREERDCI